MRKVEKMGKKERGGEERGKREIKLPGMSRSGLPNDSVITLSVQDYQITIIQQDQLTRPVWFLYFL